MRKLFWGLIFLFGLSSVISTVVFAGQFNVADADADDVQDLVVDHVLMRETFELWEDVASNSLPAIIDNHNFAQLPQAHQLVGVVGGMFEELNDKLAESMPELLPGEVVVEVDIMQLIDALHALNFIYDTLVLAPQGNFENLNLIYGAANIVDDTFGQILAQLP